MLICPFCNCAVPNVEAAIDNDWIPDYYTPEGFWVAAPVCAECAETHLEVADDGEFQIKAKG